MSGTALLGAGGHGKVVLDAMLASGIDVWGVLDDDPSKWERDVLGIVVRGPISPLEPSVDAVALGIGDNEVRRRVCDDSAVPAATVIHPRAVVSERALVGVGCVIFATAVIQAGATLGTGGIINTGAIVEHDCVVGTFAHVAPRATLAGNVRVGDNATVGMGALVLPGVSVGRGSIIGAGAVVVADVPDGTTAIGIPARPVTGR